MYFSLMFSVCCNVGLFVFLFYIYCLLLATINMQLDVYGLTNKFKRIIQSVIRYFSFMSTLSDCCQFQWYYVGMFHALICCRFLRYRSFHTRIGTCYCPLTVSLHFLLILTLQKNSCWQADVAKTLLCVTFCLQARHLPVMSSISRSSPLYQLSLTWTKSSYETRSSITVCWLLTVIIFSRIDMVATRCATRWLKNHCYWPSFCQDSFHIFSDRIVYVFYDEYIVSIRFVQKIYVFF